MTQGRPDATATAPATGDVPPPIDRHLDAAALAGLVETNGLRQMGVRPPLREYVRSLSVRRQFIVVLGRSKAYARNQSNYLGQLWSVLNPALNALTYVLIFGFLLNTANGVGNKIAYIVLGTFTYRFFDVSITAGARSIGGNMSLVRSVHFPRAVLPISQVMSELVTSGGAVVVMLAFSYASGYLPHMDRVPVTGDWLLLIPTLALLWLFNLGCAFFFARWTAITPDINNLIPFILRLVMYASGVMWSIGSHISNAALAKVFEYQPVAVYLYLVRSSVMSEPNLPFSWYRWVAAAIWAVVFLVAGFLMFWRGEERYGRD